MMSKEYIQALERIKNKFIDFFHEDNPDFDTLEQALKRLEAIDNAKPSEALKKLEMLSDCAEAMKEAPSSNWIEYADNETELDYQLWRAYEDLKSALIKAQEPKQYVDELKLVEKKLQSLEIIKEKYPDVVEVKLCKDYEHYKLRMSSKHDTEIVKIDWNDKSVLDYLLLLTEEEFNLLKEVLE